MGHYQKNAVESDEVFYARVSGCDVRKLPLDSACRYSEIKTHFLDKQANREKSKGLAKRNCGPGNKRSRVLAPASKPVNRQNSKDTRVEKGRLELTYIRIRKWSESNLLQHPMLPQLVILHGLEPQGLAQGQLKELGPLFLILSELLLVAPVPVGRLWQLKGKRVS